jgi:hypothetical protein
MNQPRFQSFTVINRHPNLKCKPSFIPALNLYHTTLLYADDQVILSNDEDNLQRATKHLNDIAKEYGMKIKTSKTKSMPFKGKNIQRAKIVIDNKIIEQVTSLNYLGNQISNLTVAVMDQNLHKYNFINGIIRRQFGKQML